MTPKRRMTPWMIGVGIVTFLAGLLFGYDQSVISCALPLLKEDLDLSTFESEVITSWVTLGATSTTVGGIVTVLALVVFIASFAFSMGPIVWTLISEIYPNRVRGRAISVATAVSWLAAFLGAQFFLSIVDAIGESTTFFLFSALCIVSFAFVWRLVAETKGRSLEEIQERWVVGGDRMLEEEAA